MAFKRKPMTQIKHIGMLGLCAMMMLSVVGCRKTGQSEATVGGDSLSADTVSAEQVADSTIYGTSDEFGMSTFTLITDQGDTLNVTRTAEDGTDGQIIGDLNEGQRYAMTTRDHNQAIGVLINLTELDCHLKDYELRNGHIIVEGDTVQIEELSDKVMKRK